MLLRPNLTVRPADQQALADVYILQVQSGHLVAEHDAFRIVLLSSAGSGVANTLTWSTSPTSL
jgi:hypothetical protein